jgi:2-(1,2-epoxy-1,2-dihydrophenyl)acetyl-CoA isomerase
MVGFNGIGLAPDSAVSLLLPALIGLGRATEATYFNQAISAELALDWGLVNKLVPAETLMAEAQVWANKLAAGPTKTYGLTKKAFNKAILPNLEEVLDYEAYLQEIAGKDGEHKEGLTAFFEKRLPDYKNLK